MQDELVLYSGTTDSNAMVSYTPPTGKYLINFYLDSGSYLFPRILSGQIKYFCVAWDSVNSRWSPQYSTNISGYVHLISHK